MQDFADVVINDSCIKYKDYLKSTYFSTRFKFRKTEL